MPEKLIDSPPVDGDKDPIDGKGLFNPDDNPGNKDSGKKDNDTGKTGKDKDDKSKDDLKDIPGIPGNFEGLPLAEQNKILADIGKKLAGKAKSADDKEVFIKRQAEELGALRKFKEEAEPIIEDIKKARDKGDTSAQKDILKEARAELEKRYEKEDVDAIMTAITKIANIHDPESDKRNDQRYIEGKLDALETRLMADKEIDFDLYGQHYQEIWQEFQRFRPGKTTREMYGNLKDAYSNVIKHLGVKLREQGLVETEEDRLKRVNGADGGLGDKSKRNAEQGDKRSSAEKIRDSIVDAGIKTRTGVFG